MSEAEGRGERGLGSGDPRQEPEDQASGRPPAVPALRQAQVPRGSAWSHAPQNQGTWGQLTQVWHLAKEGVEAPARDVTCSRRRSRDRSQGPKPRSRIIFPHDIPEVSEADSEGARGLRDGTWAVAGPGSVHPGLSPPDLGVVLLQVEGTAALGRPPEAV